MLLISGRAGLGGLKAAPTGPHTCCLLGFLPEYRIYSQARGNKARLRWHCLPHAGFLPTQRYGAIPALMRLFQVEH